MMCACAAASSVLHRLDPGVAKVKQTRLELLQEHWSTPRPPRRVLLQHVRDNFFAVFGA